MQFKRNKLNEAVVAAIATMGAGSVVAEDARPLEEVVVTATKRAVPLQDVPVAVQAITESTMKDLGIVNFEDYLVQLPGVTAGGSGPGQNTIYIRGLASTTPNLTTAGVAGLAPNVAFYLDEQPLSQAGRNLDVYAADISRIEVLSGPQGTLFGASSQAGNVRLITNKADLSDSYGSVDLGTSFSPDGEASTNVEAVYNLPLSDRLAVRGVAYFDRQGGFIDQVAGTRNVSESARFRSGSAVRANGEVVGARAGFQAGADLSDVTMLDANALVEEDANDTTYSGARVSALYEINDTWRVSGSYMRQQIESEGVFFGDPDLDDYEIQRFSDDNIEDEFDNVNWTIEGRLSALDVLYTGAFTDRSTDQVIDYTDYLFVGQYLPYYICEGSVSYPGSADPSGVCQAPNMYVNSATGLEVWSHEFRVSTPAENAVSFTGGVFISSSEMTELNDFTYPGSAADGVAFGAWAPNYPQTTGYYSDPGPFPTGVIFRNDGRRTDDQQGFFGEATWNMSESFALTVGMRWYDIEVDLEGSANGSFCNSGASADKNAYGTNISDLYDGNGQFTFIGSCNTDNHITYTAATVDADTPSAVVGALQAPESAKADGNIGKVSLAYTPTDNALLYLTWSEGFRPGLLNRPGGAAGPNGYTVPFALRTDTVTNVELGWKLDLIDNTMRFNGSLFSVEIQDLQTTIFDTSIVNLFFSDNAANAEILGIEGDVVWNVSDRLTLAGAFSALDTQILKVITPTKDVRKGDNLAFAPSFQGNLRARYQWSSNNGSEMHVMPYVSYSSSSASDIITINSAELESWTLAGITAGMARNNWSAEVYVDNLLNEKAQLSSSFVYDRHRVSYARPMTVGVRLSLDLN